MITLKRLVRRGLMILVSVILLGTLIGAAGLWWGTQTLNTPEGRARLTEGLSHALGRTVALNGPLSLGISWSGGLHLSLRRVSVANPAWAKTPFLVEAERLDLGLKLAPLLAQRIVISSLTLVDVTANLEVGPAGQKAWALGPDLVPSAVPSAERAPPATEVNATKARPMVLPILEKAFVTNMRITWRNQGAAPMTVTLQNAELAMTSTRTALHLAATIQGTPVTFTLNGGPLEPLVTDGRDTSFSGSLTYANVVLEGVGDVNPQAKTVDVTSLNLTAGDSSVRGQGKLAWSGAKPHLTATLESPLLNPADFEGLLASGTIESSSSPTSSATPASTARLLSDRPLNETGLKALDAEVRIQVGTLTVGVITVQDVVAETSLENGRLFVSPLTMKAGGGTVEGQLKLEADTLPARLALLITGRHVDLSQAASGLGGAERVLRGSTDLDVDLVAIGASPHALASSATGRVNVALLGEGGGVTLPAFSGVAGIASSLLGQGIPDMLQTPLACMAGRLVMNKGQAMIQGFIGDSPLATVMGQGGANLGTETLDVILWTRLKSQMAAALAPTLQIQGPITRPQVSVDQAGVMGSVQGIAENLLGKSLNLSAVGVTPPVNRVPVIGPSEGGRNACVEAIVHGGASKTAGASRDNQVLVPSSFGGDLGRKVMSPLKKFGHDALQGLGGGQGLGDLQKGLGKLLGGGS